MTRRGVLTFGGSGDPVALGRGFALVGITSLFNTLGPNLPPTLAKLHIRRLASIATRTGCEVVPTLVPLKRRRP